MTSTSPFLNLPGELRNQIYLEVALDAPEIRLHEGRVVLPALGSVCRQVRKEMSHQYQTDVTFDISKPINAHVTNFNFHHLSRWLEKNSRDLKHRLEAPRLLTITSVLLSPDFTVSTASPHAPMEARARQNALDMYESLQYMERSLEAWSSTWIVCKGKNSEGSRIRGLSEPIGRHDLTAERSGTTYAIVWNPRTIHRQHCISQSNPTLKEHTGFCYRGDLCQQFLLHNMKNLLKRSGTGLRSNNRPYDEPYRGAFRFARELDSKMWQAHNNAHADRHLLRPKELNFGLQLTYSEPEVAALYWGLDKLNRTRGVFKRKLCKRYSKMNWIHPLTPLQFPCPLRWRGAKRTSSQCMGDEVSSDDLTLEHHTKRRLVIVGPNRFRTSKFSEPNMDLVISLMGKLDLNE